MGDSPKIKSASETGTAPKKRKARKVNPDKIKFANASTGEVYTKPGGVDKRSRDILQHHLGVDRDEKLGNVIWVNEDNPLVDKPLCPGNKSPLCAQCKLDTLGSRHPYIPPFGSEEPLITVITEQIVRDQDDMGELVSPEVATNLGGTNRLWTLFAENVEKTGVDPSKDVRWLSITRCAVRGGKRPNLSTKANWCRYHAVQDLRLHPPKLIMTFGSAALGALSHKSNAFDWQGKVLTYRGWPDDWLMNQKYMLPRPGMMAGGEQVIGHPVFGPPPTEDDRIPLYPLISPYHIVSQQNDLITNRWLNAIFDGIKCAVKGVKPKTYLKPWYNVTTDPDVVVRWMYYLYHEHPGTLVTFDTETTGLKAFGQGQKIVFMMFRWDDPDTGEPMSIGFPWDYPESPLFDCVDELTPYVLKALYASDLCGHNLTFDALFTCGTLKGCDVDRLAPQCKHDTWHMSFASKQQRGSLGLERVTYDHAPELAGYEEEMALLIKLCADEFDPAAGKGGHYAMCPEELWPTHFVPYVMGDVETCHVSRKSIEDKLEKRPCYSIPLADPQKHGEFRWFKTPSRHWVYHNIMSPASQMLIKAMARGMHVDIKKLADFEEFYPRKITDVKDKMLADNPRIAEWVTQMENTPPEEGKQPWEFDLENKQVLKDLLFVQLGLPIQRLTKAGRTDPAFNTQEKVDAATFEEKFPFAAVDKFTLNKLAADHEIARPLLEYRKLYKLYTTYVRPLRNFRSKTIDKKEREKDPHLWLACDGGDDRLHASFMLTGTRGGRLSCRDPNLQQLPSDSDIKEMFVSRFGERGCMYAGDLSQIELRLLAAACGDPNMLKAYHDDLDLHTLTTSRIFKLPYETFTKDYMAELQDKGRGDEAKELDLKRRIGKTCNFLTGYGGGAFGLQTTLANSKIYLPIEECEDILYSFFDSYPTLKRYLGVYKKFIMSTRVAVSLLGRVRILEDALSADSELASKALRAGCNHLIQATASDMMLTCLIAIENIMRDRGLESILVSTVHDSLLIDAVKDELVEIHDIVDTVLNNIPDVMQIMFGDDFDLSWMIVPFAGDCEVGPDYKHMNKIPLKGEVDWDKLLKA
jgi:DNA polymerase I-like protein with 3'-5' exonuclease and polymerase domains/uracil-DNA glycosylase